MNPRACSECGCTDDDCSACIARTGRQCAWICTACVSDRGELEARAARVSDELDALARGLPGASVAGELTETMSRLHELARELRTPRSGACAAATAVKDKANGVRERHSVDEALKEVLPSLMALRAALNAQSGRSGARTSVQGTARPEGERLAEGRQIDADPRKTPRKTDMGEGCRRRESNRSSQATPAKPGRTTSHRKRGTR
jgi:hypothetical protein